MGGALRSHVAMVEDCRPFQDSDHRPDPPGLDYLVEWDAAIVRPVRRPDGRWKAAAVLSMARSVG